MIAMKKDSLLPGLVAILVALLLVFSFLLVCTSVLHAARLAPVPATVDCVPDCSETPACR